ncbi:hypothetical protein ACF08B_22755 [Streptomyces sp. NPDC015139]|uniref:hypothetical protein n=1 Tax=Streptomyces sp. NPDC015139 TaxID=3364942 RepID=UPI0036FA0265
MTTDPATPTHATLLDRWLDDLQVLAARLEQVHLPADFPFDYSPGSLAVLEQALLDGEHDDAFRRAATAYIGEVLMDVCGGRWDIDPATGGEDGDPLVSPDPDLGLPPLSVGTLVDVALAEGSGEVLTRERDQLADAVSERRRAVPGWEPHKERSPLDPIGPQPADAWLQLWLAEREEAHPEWAHRLFGSDGPGDGDFTAAGLDVLEQRLRARYGTLADFDADREGPFLQGAVWYLGQVLCRHHDSTWVYWAIEPDAPRGSHHHAENPWSGIPFTHQPHKRKAAPRDPLGILRGVVRYGTAYHLTKIIADV